MYLIKKLDSNDILLFREDLIDIFMQMEESADKKNKRIWEEKVNELNTFVKENAGTIFAAFDDNKLISFVWIYIRFFANEKRVHINYFGTNEKYRGKGIGKELLELTEQFAKNNEVNKIDLNVEVNNYKAINFYRKNEFNDEGILMSKEILRGCRE